MIVVAGIRISPMTARRYFGIQAAAGTAWWVAVFLTGVVQDATLGNLPAITIAALDLPMFVLSSALVAFGLRWALWVVVPWTIVVAASMAIYATFTTLAGWGALLMVLAAVASTAAAMIIVIGRVPIEWATTGPFRFQSAQASGRTRLLVRTGVQMIVFWGLFLVVFPMAIAWVEARWMLRLDIPLLLRFAGGCLLIVATVLGVWAAISMSTRGDGTPLPSEMPRRLVVAGPYRYVRNPMAIAGIAQGVAVGLLYGSWLVIAYALCGSLFWNTIVRPLEEADMEERFGAEFVSYRARVACWFPIKPTVSPTP